MMGLLFVIRRCDTSRSCCGIRLRVKATSLALFELAMEMDWNLYGLEASRMYFETRESEQPVMPPSVHAS